MKRKPTTRRNLFSFLGKSVVAGAAAAVASQLPAEAKPRSMPSFMTDYNGNPIPPPQYDPRDVAFTDEDVVWLYNHGKGQPYPPIEWKPADYPLTLSEMAKWSYTP